MTKYFVTFTREEEVEADNRIDAEKKAVSLLMDTLDLVQVGNEDTWLEQMFAINTEEGIVFKGNGEQHND